MAHAARSVALVYSTITIAADMMLVHICAECTCVRQRYRVFAEERRQESNFLHYCCPSLPKCCAGCQLS
eukprot:3413902-Pleurochrysis_carterae.AAC.7